MPLHPVRSLFDFARINNIGAGATATIEFTIKAKSILLATSQGDLVIAPGEYMSLNLNGRGNGLMLLLYFIIVFLAVYIYIFFFFWFCFLPVRGWGGYV